MHTSGGFGKVYRSHFRRDWPTGQAFPNLWPHRIKLGNWAIGGFPSDNFDDMQGTLSAVGVVADDGQSIRYEWTQGSFFDIATLLLTMTPGHTDREQGWVFLFSNTTDPGFLRLVVDGYLLDDEESKWQVTYPFPAGRWTYQQFGPYDFIWSPPDPLIEMFAARWEELPVDERSPS